MKAARSKTFRSLAYIGLVVALFLIGDRALSWMLGELVSRSQFRFSRLYQGSLHYDVLVVGNSRAVHSIFAPGLGRDLCLSVFNMAYNGMSAEIEEAMVRDYLDRNDPPKAVIIEVTNVSGDNALLNDVRLYAPDSPRLERLIEREAPTAALWMRISHLFAFDNELSLRALYYLDRTDQDWRIGATEPMSPQVVAELGREQRVPPSSVAAEVAALKRLTAYLEAHHIEPVLYVAPFHPAYRKLVPGLTLWEADLQRELGGAPVIIDLSQKLDRGGDFADLVHVNSAGSDAATALMAERLKNRLVADVAQSTCPTSETAHERTPADVAAR